MRLSALFLALSLIINPLLAQEQSSSNKGIFAKAKDLAAQAIGYAKKGSQFLISSEGQALLIAAYCAPFIVEVFCHGFFKGTRVSLSELPQPVQDAYHDMDPKRAINFKIWDGPSSYAQINEIVLKKSHLLLSPKMQRYIIGHEIAHIEKNHALKLKIGTLCILLGIPIALACAKCALDDLADNNKKDDLKGKCITASQKTVDFIVNNPLIPFVVMMTVWSWLTQYIEKEADIVSTTKLNCAQGAVDYANFCIERAKERDANSSWTSYVSPVEILNNINKALGWTWHHPRKKALEYLIPLAEQQKVV